MQISINTPALLFPAFTLLMLAYTNRFLAFASLIRKLNVEYKESNENKEMVKEQIFNLRRRLHVDQTNAGERHFQFFPLCAVDAFHLL